MRKPSKSLILTILSILGLGTTTVLAVRSGMKTRQILDEHPEAEDIKSKIGLTWKAYIATIVSMVATGTCIISAHTLDSKQIAALSGVVATGATTFSKYRSKVREVVGPETEQQIFTSVQSDMKQTIFPEMIDPCKCPNDTLFLDEISGRYFMSSFPRVMHAVYHLNRVLSTQLCASADEWYDFLAIDNDPALRGCGWWYEFLSENWEFPWIDVVISDEVRADGVPYKRISFDQGPMSPEEIKDFDPDLYRMLF